MRAGTMPGLVLVLVAVAGGVSGCGSSTSVCQPADLQVAPDTVRAGGVVTVRSGPSSCDLGLGDHAHYVITFQPGTGSAHPVIARPPVADDGTFRARVRIPAGAPAGEATLGVHAPGHDFCADRGNGESCPGYDVAVTVTR